MELLNQANLLIAIAAPIALIVVINLFLQRGNTRRPLFEAPRRSLPATPAKRETRAATAEAANDEQHQRAA
jgi:hypothetical protein